MMEHIANATLHHAREFNQHFRLIAVLMNLRHHCSFIGYTVWDSFDFQGAMADRSGYNRPEREHVDWD